MRPRDDQHDVLVIGAGPAGSIAAIELARREHRVCVLEKESHPRFRIGESLLPRTYRQIADLELLDALADVPHIPKGGAEFLFGHGEEPGSDFHFRDALDDAEPLAFNVERAPFDAMLVAAARDAGATVLERTGVEAIELLEDGDVCVRAGGQQFRARYLIDASGQATVVARHLGTRTLDAHLRMVAHYVHATGVERREGALGGYPTFVMCREGWFWMIPINQRVTSVGIVLDTQASSEAGVPANRILQWAIANCPEMIKRCRGTTFPETNIVTSDFSYACRPYAGPGHFLVGDAAVFIDPVFSTGVCMGMMGGQLVAHLLSDVLGGRMSIAAARHRYVAVQERCSKRFFKLVRLFYGHGFREMFLHGRGPFDVHRAVMSLLAGDIFPKASWSLRWRLAAFHALHALHGLLPVVPRRRTFSLLEHAAAISPATDGQATAPLEVCRPR